MSGRGEPVAYWCDVVAEGGVYGTGRVARYVLGAFQTISPVLALRWLRAEALRTADRLDPDPRHSAWVRPFMRVPSAPVPDCPAGLRAWAAEADGRRAARERLKAGRPLCATFPDTDCTYTLSVRPVWLPAAAPGRPSAGVALHRLVGRAGRVGRTPPAAPARRSRSARLAFALRWDAGRGVPGGCSGWSWAACRAGGGGGVAGG